MNNCVNFENIFKKFSDVNFNPTSLIPDKQNAYSLFTKNFMFLKLITLILGITLLIINLSRYQTYGLVKENAGIFVRESIIFALSGVLPFLLVAFLRNKKQCPKNILFMSITIFIMFFSINFILELSGFYGFVFGEGKISAPKSDEKNVRQNFVNDVGFMCLIILIALYAIPLLSMLFSVAVIRDTKVEYKFNVNKLVMFIVESLLFGVLSAFPIFLVSRDHGDYDTKKTTQEFLIVVAKFTILHFILQLSGFYNHLFA